MTVYPIGHYVGERVPEGRHAVRVGFAEQTLTADEFGVWVLAHGTLADVSWGVSDVAGLAAETVLTGAPAAITRLTEAGALAVVEPGADRTFAETYGLRPLLVGLGNTDAAPDRYRVGFPGLPPVAELSAGTYELWQWGHVTPSLWHGCEVREKVAAGLGEPVSADEVLTAILGNVRELLVHGCAYLDLAHPRAHLARPSA